MHQQSKGRICSAIYLGVLETGVGWGVCDCSSTEGLDNSYIALLEHVVLGASCSLENVSCMCFATVR